MPNFRITKLLAPIVIPVVVPIVAGLIVTAAHAQDDDAEQLRMTAMEALMSAPPEKAIPIASRVLQSNHDDALKSRALFILSQFDDPEAKALLTRTALEGSRPLRLEAIRMIGINGNPDTLSTLEGIYAAGDIDIRKAVLSAFMIADDRGAVYRIAAATKDRQEFENAVNMLAAMGAIQELRELGERTDFSDSMINAYAISGDVETLMTFATDPGNPERQLQAIRGLGIVGGEQVNDTLMSVFRNAASADVKSAALNGLLIAGHEQGVLALYRESNDAAEKRELLRTLANMGSDEVWDIVDNALGSDQ